MAQPRFHVPSEDPNHGLRNFNGAPRPLPKCDYLIEKATGIIHPYHPGLAARSDLVEVYTGPLPWEESKAKKANKPKAKVDAPPAPSAPPAFEHPVDADSFE